MNKFNVMDRVKLKTRRLLKRSEIIGSGWDGSPAAVPVETIGVVLEVTSFPLRYKVEFPVDENYFALLETREDELDLVKRGAAGTW